jgi:hypothetical protein
MGGDSWSALGPLDLNPSPQDVSGTLLLAKVDMTPLLSDDIPLLRQTNTSNLTLFDL